MEDNLDISVHFSSTTVSNNLIDPGPAPVIVRSASFPFNKATADVVLRSSDSVDFRVRRGILCEASQFFDDMFSLPQPEDSMGRSGSDAAAIPTITVAENAKTLDHLLRLCYPINDPVLDQVDDVRHVLEAAIKYEMSEAIKLMGKALLDFTATDALRVWAIACHYRQEGIAKSAAQATLGQSIEAIYVKELEEIKAGVYHRLLQYHGNPYKLAFDIDPSPVTNEGSENYSSQKGAHSSGPTGMHPASFFDGGSTPDTDVILRSSDNFNFHAHRVILAMSSPVLKEMLPSLCPVPKANESDMANELHISNPLIVRLTEDSTTLGHLLSVYYALDDPTFHDLRSLRLFLDAALNYNMTKATSVARQELLKFAEKDSFGVYLIAARHNMSQVADAAAKCLLRNPIAEDYYSPELEETSAGDLYRLRTHNHRCREAARNLAQNIGWLPNSRFSTWTWFTCSDCQGVVGVRRGDATCKVRTWWKEYMDKASRELYLRPCGPTVADPTLSDSALIKAVILCNTSCRRNAIAHLRQFNELFAEKIDEVVAAVKFEVR
ncbi:hypothetical protein BKA93DRAFT_500522 [Sparassis latifolia]